MPTRWQLPTVRGAPPETPIALWTQRETTLAGRRAAATKARRQSPGELIGCQAQVAVSVWAVTTTAPPPTADPTRHVRLLGRWVLATFLAVAGIGHFRNADEFLAQVPPWMPAATAVVAISGVVELAMALALVALPRWRVQVGWFVAAFFIIVFPGNISQFLTQTDAFGLDSDVARFVRLLFQPVLVIWALWCTGAWRALRERRRHTAT